MSQFGTPLFSEKDICIFLSELGMSASADQLGKPSFEFVQPIYENLVTALTGVTRRAAGWRKAAETGLAAARPATRRRCFNLICLARAGKSCSSRSSWQ
jgi:hypothetical protein